jgi:hypothetical protein
MKKIIIILFILSSTVLNSRAQISGYMGKRMLFMFDLHTRPSFSEPNVNGNNGITSLNTKQSLALEYVTGEHNSIGIAYSFYNTMFDFKEIQVSIADVAGFGNSTFIPIGLGSMSVKNYSIYFKFFKGGNLAPLGTYLKLQFDYFAWDNTYNWKQNLGDDPAQNASIQKWLDNSSYESYGINMTFGNQLIYFDHLVVNYALQFGYLFNGGRTAIFGDIDPSDSVYPAHSDALKYASSARVFSHNLWSINLGIGYLLF